MATQISGDTGVSKVQDGAVSTNTLASGAVTPAKTQVGALPSMVRLNTANGYGSTNTKVRRFSNVVTNQGSDITYSDSATLGASITINAAGVYLISYGECFTLQDYFAVSINSVNLTTTPDSLPLSEILQVNLTPAANLPAEVSWGGYLPAGTVLRPHGSSPTGSFANAVQFTIVRVA